MVRYNWVPGPDGDVLKFLQIRIKHTHHRYNRQGMLVTVINSGGRATSSVKEDVGGPDDQGTGEIIHAVDDLITGRVHGAKKG